MENETQTTTPTDGINLIKDLVQNFGYAYEKMGHVNIIITGKTGVGKSTLINSVFRDNLATTGVGKPVTQETKCIEKSGTPVRIYDTKGLELGKDTQKDIKDDIYNIIDYNLENGDYDKFIHVIWYCINTASDRI